MESLLEYNGPRGTGESTRTVVMRHIIYWVVLAVIIGVERLYNQGLIEWSVVAMLWIQNHETEAGKVVFTILSIIGVGAPYFLTGIYFINKNSERGRGFYHILFISGALYLMSMTKIGYGEPRMFWVDKDIVPDECITEYGNPSGHTFLAIGYPIFLWLDVFESRDMRERHQERMTKKSIAALIFALLWSFAIGFARLYVRVHSWNQIVFGWQLGLWVAFYFHFCIRDQIISHVNTLAQTSRLDSSTRTKLMLTATLLYFLMVGTLVLAYLLRANYEKKHPEMVKGWISEIQRKCPEKQFGKSRFFAENSIVMSGLSSLAYGAYLGIIAYREKVGRVWPGMLNTDFKETLIRFLFHLIPVPIAAIMFIYLASWPVVVQIIFQGFMPLGLVGFLVTFLPLLLAKNLGYINLDSQPRNYLFDADQEKY